jgi:hypothetical protein
MTYRAAVGSPLADYIVNYVGNGVVTLKDAVTGGTAPCARTGVATMRDGGAIYDVAANTLRGRLAASGCYGFLVENAHKNNFIRSYILGDTEMAAWTADAGLTAAPGASPHGFYGSAVGANLAADASNRAWWQQYTATALASVVSCYCWLTGGGVVSATDMQLCAVASTATPVGTLLTTTFTAVPGMTVGGAQVYRATALFTGTAAAWTVGVAVMAGKTVNVDLLQSGASPRTAAEAAISPTYVPTAASAVTRTYDLVTINPSGATVSGMTWHYLGEAGVSGSSLVASGATGFRAFMGSGTVLRWVAISTGVKADTTVTAGARVLFTGSWVDGGRVLAYLNGAGKVTGDLAGTGAVTMAFPAWSGNTNASEGSFAERIIFYNGQQSDANVLAVYNDISGGPKKKSNKMMFLSGSDD